MLGSRPVPLNTEGSSNFTFARTPAKALLKHRGALQENAVYLGSMTGNAKGKASVLQTPFQPTTQMRKGTQAENPIVVLHRPLGDKTPFPNRQLPVQTLAPQPGKMGKLSMLDPALDKTPGSLLLPSARRKSLRLPRSASKKFTTPMQQGRHWDVSDGEVDPDISTGSIEAQEVEQEDYDEVEYMPPKVPEQPYEPLFDLPDYKESGRTILNISQSYLYDDTTDLYYATDISLQIDTEEALDDSGAFILHSLALPKLESNDDDLIFPPEPSINSSVQSSPQKPIAQRRTTREDAPAGPSRPMTRAASKALAQSRTPTPPNPLQRPFMTHSRSGSGIAGRATPSSDHSTSRPGTSTGLRGSTSGQPRTTTIVGRNKAGYASPDASRPSSRSTRLSEDLDVVKVEGLDATDDFLFDV